MIKYTVGMLVRLEKNDSSLFVVLDHNENEQSTLVRCLVSNQTVFHRITTYWVANSRVSPATPADVLSMFSQVEHVLVRN